MGIFCSGGNVNRVQKVLSDLHIQRRKILTVLVIIILIPMFQNCSGGFSTGSSEAAGIGVNSASGGGVGGGSTTSPTAPIGPTGPSLAEVQAKCKALTRTPSLSAPALSSITVDSGLGSKESGDQKTNTSISISSDLGITDKAKFDSLNCAAQFAIQLNCEVISDNPNYPISMTNAFDMNGVNLLTMTTPKSQLNLAKDSYMNNNCSVGFPLGATSTNFQIMPDTRNQRCSEGSFTIRLTARNSVTGTQGNNTSAAQVFKVNMRNACWNESKLKDSAGNIQAVANFGTAVAMNNGWAAVVAPTEDTGAILDVGAVYMYKLVGSSWIQKQKVMISDAAARDTIASVAISGNRMVIGSPYRAGQGMAFVFDVTNDVWTLTRQISPPTSQADQYFGQSVAITANNIFVGAPNFNGGGQVKAGSVSVFSSDGATFLVSIMGEAANNAFGSALAADGSLIAIGAPQAEGRLTLSPGSAYVYSISGSTATQVAKKTGTMMAETFGATVALIGNRLAVGSPNYSEGTKTAQGRVTFYNSYADTTIARTYTGGASGDNLGQGLALSSTGIYIGSPYANGRIGSVDHYLYTDLTKIYYRNLAYTGAANSAFGYAVAASGNDVVIGARIKNDPNDNSGASYIYRYK